MNYRWIAALVVVGVGYLSLSSFGRSPFVGQWRQVASTAGACPECRLEIEETDGAFSVTSSSNWMATAHSDANDVEASLSGKGQWGPNVVEPYRGKPFSIVFTQDGAILFMEMTLRGEAYRDISVQAKFERL